MNAATASKSAGKTRLAPLVSIAAAVVLLDQVTKIIVQRRFFLGESIPVIDGFFNLTYVRNSGAAFSFLASGDPAWVIPFFIITTLIVSVGIVYYHRKTDPAQRLHRLGLSLVLGGAVGNLIDRLVHQSVVDFLDFYAGTYHWPAFNVADSAITTGVGLILLEMLLAGKSGKVSA